MFRLFKCAVLLLLALVATLVCPTSQAQQMKEVAPVPVQISAAKRVFVSNAGVDTWSLHFALRDSGDPDLHYNQFYAAMKNWGRYELVAGPADADLVFEVRFARGEFRVTILDAKTHFILWKVTAPVETATRKQTRLKNLQKSLTDLMGNLQRLASQPRALP